jgi:biopolymer transport protein ExbB/TolQ
MIAHLNTSMTTPRRWLIRLGGSWVQWIIILTAFFTLVLVWRRWRLVDAQSTIIQKWSSGRNLAEKKTDDSEPSDPDEISVAREGEAIVPYSREKAKEYFASGQLLPTDWGWHDGMDEWKPINEVLGVAAPAQTSATTVQGNGNWASLSEGWASSRASKTWAVKQLDSRGNPLHGIVKASIVHHLDGKPESELEDKIETRVGQVKEDLEKKCYTLLMYLLGALPSLGFIGTLLGIGAALTKTNSLFEASDSVSKQQSMNEITYQLGIAFDTTLIALVASLFVGLIIQWLKGQEFRMIEEFSSKISSDIVPELYRKLKPTGTDEE